MGNIPTWHPPYRETFHTRQSLQRDVQKDRLRFCSIRRWKANSNLGAKQVYYAF